MLMPLFDSERLEILSLSWQDVIIEGFVPEHVTPVGYDFTFRKIERMSGAGYLGVHEKRLPTYSPIYPRGITYNLYPGMYIVELSEVVRIPKGFAGFMWPRSTLLRCGVDLATAVWDAGYTGRSKTTMVVHNPNGFILEQGTRIGHMVLVKQDILGGMYSGSYQNEGTS